VVGQVCRTRASVVAADALGLGPIAVAPDRQRAGLGQALMHGVCLLGEPAFSGRFGFVAADVLGIGAPDRTWGRHFQARALTAFDAGRHAAPFAYAAPFRAL
jgi:putative acetyltransferase